MAKIKKKMRIGWKKVTIRVNGWDLEGIVKLEITGRVVCPIEKTAFYIRNAHGDSVRVPCTKYRTSSARVLSVVLSPSAHNLMKTRTVPLATKRDLPRTRSGKLIGTSRFVTSSKALSYYAGKRMKPDRFNKNPKLGSAGGIHFFEKRSEAVHY